MAVGGQHLVAQAKWFLLMPPAPPTSLLCTSWAQSFFSACCIALREAGGVSRGGGALPSTYKGGFLFSGSRQKNVLLLHARNEDRGRENVQRRWTDAELRSGHNVPDERHIGAVGRHLRLRAYL
jgi:hypothetical protein